VLSLAEINAYRRKGCIFCGKRGGLPAKLGFFLLFTMYCGCDYSLSLVSLLIPCGGSAVSPPPSPRPAPHSINSTHILHAYVYGSPLYGWETLRKPGSRSIWSRLLAYVRIYICGCLVIILPLCVDFVLVLCIKCNSTYLLINKKCLYCLDLDCSVFLSITELIAGHETGLLFGMELCLLLGMKLCLLLGMQLSLLLDMKLCLYFRKERCYC
jgi:hypothetical protein